MSHAPRTARLSARSRTRTRARRRRRSRWSRLEAKRPPADRRDQAGHECRTSRTSGPGWRSPSPIPPTRRRRRNCGHDAAELVRARRVLAGLGGSKIGTGASRAAATPSRSLRATICGSGRAAEPSQRWARRHRRTNGHGKTELPSRRGYRDRDEHRIFWLRAATATERGDFLDMLAAAGAAAARRARRAFRHHSRIPSSRQSEKARWTRTANAHAAGAARRRVAARAAFDWRSRTSRCAGNPLGAADLEEPPVHPGETGRSRLLRGADPGALQSTALPSRSRARFFHHACRCSNPSGRRCSSIR